MGARHDVDRGVALHPTIFGVDTNHITIAVQVQTTTTAVHTAVVRISTVCMFAFAKDVAWIATHLAAINIDHCVCQHMSILAAAKHRTHNIGIKNVDLSLIDVGISTSSSNTFSASIYIAFGGIHIVVFVTNFTSFDFHRGLTFNLT